MRPQLTKYLNYFVFLLYLLHCSGKKIWSFKSYPIALNIKSTNFKPFHRIFSKIEQGISPKQMTPRGLRVGHVEVHIVHVLVSYRARVKLQRLLFKIVFVIQMEKYDLPN